MNDPQETIFPFKGNTKYKMRAVTYDVTAHFCSDKETLKSKIYALITEDIRKFDSLCSIARSHSPTFD